MTGSAGLGSSAHRALIGHVVAHYQHDRRVRAVAVFGSVSAGTWHELSDVDFDLVISDDAQVVPADEIAALFGARATVVLARGDSADVVLDSLEEVSVRWHTLQTTSPNITATVRVVAGGLTDGDLVAAGEANRAEPDVERILDTAVRDAIGARKALLREHDWEATAAVERVRASLTALKGRRDGLRLQPSSPAQALAALLAEIEASYELGPRRRALLSASRNQSLSPAPSLGNHPCVASRDGTDPPSSAA
jgi:Nucleotidyltransferase domain